MKRIFSELSLVIIISLFTGCVSCVDSSVEDGNSIGGSGLSQYGVSSSKDNTSTPITAYEGMKLIWNEEFNNDVQLDEILDYEYGFVRNKELQWYQDDNVSVHDDMLDIEIRVERKINPNYIEADSSWTKNRPTAEYTSGSVWVKKLVNIQKGRIEIKAKFPIIEGCWPSINLFSTKHNVAEDGYEPVFDYVLRSSISGLFFNMVNEKGNLEQPERCVFHKSISHFIEKDALWMDKCHILRFDFDVNIACVYLDEECLATVEISSGNERFQKLLLNMFIGGTPDYKSFPAHFMIDYIRIYQKE